MVAQLPHGVSPHGGGEGEEKKPYAAFTRRLRAGLGSTGQDAALSTTTNTNMNRTTVTINRP